MQYLIQFVSLFDPKSMNYSNLYSNNNNNNIIGKAIPLQSRTVPEGSRRLRLPDFKTVGTSWRL